MKKEGEPVSRAFDKVLVAPDASIRAVLKVIDASGLGVALVVKDGTRLMGLVTDGDLRRAILDGHELDSSVSAIMNAKPVTAQKDLPREEIFSLFDYEIRHIPVVDEERRVCELLSFNDLSKKIPWALPYIGSEEENEVADTVRSTWLTMGPKVQRLEREVASYVGAKHAVAVCNGTAALDVALKTLGIRPGDEVIVPALTYIATANAVLYQHATPVLADVEPDTFNLNPRDVASKITPKTRAILAVDYGGQSADYDALAKIARGAGVHLVEDGAQSIGAAYKGRALGSFGVVNTISFHAAKVITSVEGGMVLTEDDELAARARIIRNQGEDPVKKYYHVLLGHNYRMTDLHAAIGLVQFGKLARVLQRRAEIAAYYTQQLAHFEDRIVLPRVRPTNKHAWFFYAIRVKNRDEIVRYLKSKGIDTRIAWPLAIHRQPVYQEMLACSQCPVADEIAGTVLNLPMYYDMTEEELRYVVIHVKDAVSQMGSKIQ